MALMLLGAAGKLLGGAAVKGAAKGAAKKSLKSKAKGFIKGKAKGKLKSISKDKLLGKKSNAIVKSPAGALVATPSAPVAAPTSGGSSLLSEVIEIKITTIKIKDLLASNLAQQKAAVAAERKQAEKDRKAQKEAQLESGKGDTGGGIKLPGPPKMGILDRIMRFLGFTLLGSLLGVLMKNSKPILKAFNVITDNLMNGFKVLQYTLSWLTTSGSGILKALYKTVRFFVKLTYGIGKIIFNIGKLIFNALKNVANTLYDFLKPIVTGAIDAAVNMTKELAKRAKELGAQMIKRVNQIRKFLQRAGKAAYGAAIKGGGGVKGATKAVKTVAQRSAKQASETAAKEAVEATAKTATKEAAEAAVERGFRLPALAANKEAAELAVKETSEIVVKETAEKVATEAAETASKNTLGAVLKNAKRFKAILKRSLPGIGALIGFGIDVALGEKIDRAAVGSLGSTAGAALGGLLGQIAIPIPFFGAAAGGIVGGAIGEYLAKELYEKIRGAMGMGRSDGADAEVEVDQKFFGGMVKKAKNFLGMGDKKGYTSSSSGVPKKPRKFAGLEVSRIPLKNGETYYGIRAKDNLFGFGSGLKSIFGSKDSIGDNSTPEPPQPGDGRDKEKGKEDTESSFDFSTALSNAIKNPGLTGDASSSSSGSSGLNFGGGSVKKYNVEKSASYDDPSSSPILVPMPMQQQLPSMPGKSGGGKRHKVLPMFGLNSDINDLVSQAVFY
tara:strand:- start:10101 stop:12281 length:2181 start_codon:yes stop_codon:yes gene_type:complete